MYVHVHKHVCVCERNVYQISTNLCKDQLISFLSCSCVCVGNEASLMPLGAWIYTYLWRSMDMITGVGLTWKLVQSALAHNF